MVRAKKHLGQHFLKEPAIAARIADALTGHGGYQRVLEVGPGMGALTTHLLQKGFDLHCVELDRESVTHLEQHFPSLQDRVINGDLLRLDLERLFPGPLAIIGNFPYNISTQILFKMLEHEQQVKELVGMFQKEVADRVVAPPGSRTYGITSVLVQAFYKAESLFHVEPGSFIPPPKVRSSVIRLQRNDTVALPCDKRMFFKIVKAAFNQRRKTLRNALRSGFDPPLTIPEDLAQLRAERLSVSDFVRIAQAATQ